jgi:hypothetical protein
MSVVILRRKTSLPFKIRDEPLVKFSTLTVDTDEDAPEPAKLIR